MNRQELLREVEFLLTRPPGDDVTPFHLSVVVVRLVGRACADLVEDDAQAWTHQRDRSDPNGDGWHECHYKSSVLRKAGGRLRILTGARDDLVTVDDD